jgi:hypothetical protein
MDINYWWVSMFALLVIILVIWLIRRNRKDEKILEKEIIQSELKPDDEDQDGPVSG